MINEEYKELISNLNDLRKFDREQFIKVKGIMIGINMSREKDVQHETKES